MDKIFNEVNTIKELILRSDRTIETASLKLMEELGELVSANFGLKSYKHNDPKLLQEEAVDVLQNAISLYFLIQYTYPFDGEKIMKQKNEKWKINYINSKYRKGNN